MVWLNRNLPPQYDHTKTYTENFAPFFDWASSLRGPFRQIPKIGAELGFGIKTHPIGFIAVYLSEPWRGFETVGVQGIAHINIYPPGAPLREDIHCHGFEFHSGVAAGVLVNTRHYPDWKGSLPDGEGYVGYETTVDFYGRNHTVQATNATVAVPRSEAQELEAGDTYSLRPIVDFHSVSSGDDGAVTVFCKTPTFEGNQGRTLVLRKPDQDPTPAVY